MLTRLEREVITDSMLKVQSIQASLDRIDADKVPGNEEIRDCLESADKSFREALRAERSDASQIKRPKH